jgi:uncharacterized small protein (DUF1192 family)
MTVRVVRPLSKSDWVEQGFILDSDRPIESVRAQWSMVVDGAKRPLRGDLTWRGARPIQNEPRLYVAHLSRRVLRDPALGEAAWTAYSRFIDAYCKRLSKEGKLCIRTWSRDTFVTTSLGVGHYFYDLEIRHSDGQIEVLRDLELHIKPVVSTQFESESLDAFDLVGNWMSLGALRAEGSTNGDTWSATIKSLPPLDAEDKRLLSMPGLRLSVQPEHYKFVAQIYLETLAEGFQVGLMYVSGKPNWGVGTFPVGLAVWLFPDRTFSVEYRRPNGIWEPVAPRSPSSSIKSGWNTVQIFKHLGFGQLTVAINNEFVWCFKGFLSDLENIPHLTSISALYRSGSPLNSAQFSRLEVAPHGHLIGGKYAWLTEGGGNRFLHPSDDNPFAIQEALSADAVEVLQESELGVTLRKTEPDRSEHRPCIHNDLPTPAALELSVESVPEPAAPAQIELDRLTDDYLRNLQFPTLFGATSIDVLHAEAVTAETRDPAADLLAPGARLIYDNANEAYRQKEVREFNFISIRSGYRGIAEQADLYEAAIRVKYEGGSANPADPPGMSTHNHGVAIDAVRGSDKQITEELKAAGWSLTHSNEPWHFDATSIAAWGAVQKKIASVAPKAKELRPQLIEKYENRKKIRDKFPRLEADKKRLTDEQQRLDAEKRRLEARAADLTSRQAALEAKRSAIEAETSRLAELQSEIARMRFDQCPNGQSFEACSHEDLKARWTSARNQKIQSYEQRSARLRGEAESYRRATQVYTRDRDSYLRDSSEYRSDAIKFNADKKILDEQVLSVREFEAAINMAQQKINRLLAEISGIVGAGPAVESL